MIWPDWTGRACAIVASGPSVKKADVELLKDRLPVIAIKKNIELAPWADVAYGCDLGWWRHVRGLPEFRGLKVAYDPKASEFACAKVEIPDHARSNHLLFGKTGTIGGGGCSGFQALNLALQFGAVRILGLGFDCQARSGVHWYGRNNWSQGSNPSESNFRRWISAFGSAAAQLEDRGVEFVNASPLSALTCFPKAGVAETLERWGL